MDRSNPFVIKRDRKQMALLSLGALIFVVMGVWMLLVDPSELGARHSPLHVRTIGLASIVFFGACLFVSTRHLVSLGAAIVLDDEGILDRVSVMRVGRIPWADIKGFAGCSIAGKRMLVIRLSDPGKYIGQAWPWMRPMHRYNMKKCGSPVLVLSDVLVITFNELISTCEYFHQQYHSRPDKAAT